MRAPVCSLVSDPVPFFYFFFFFFFFLHSLHIISPCLFRTGTIALDPAFIMALADQLIADAGACLANKFGVDISECVDFGSLPIATLADLAPPPTFAAAPFAPPSAFSAAPATATVTASSATSVTVSKSSTSYFAASAASEARAGAATAGERGGVLDLIRSVKRDAATEYGGDGNSALYESLPQQQQQQQQQHADTMAATATTASPAERLSRTRHYRLRNTNAVPVLLTEVVCFPPNAQFALRFEHLTVPRVRNVSALPLGSTLVASAAAAAASSSTSLLASSRTTGDDDEDVDEVPVPQRVGAIVIPPHATLTVAGASW